MVCDGLGKTTHSNYEQLIVHTSMCFSITGSTERYDFFFLTQVFPSSILNPATYQQTSPLTNFSSKAAAVISRLYKVLGEREHSASLFIKLGPKSPTASSQSSSRKQKWFSAPLVGTRAGSFCLDWFQPQWKYKTTTANRLCDDTP